MALGILGCLTLGPWMIRAQDRQQRRRANILGAAVALCIPALIIAGLVIVTGSIGLG